MNYWPGTKIPKSKGNVFTAWKESKPSFANDPKWRQSLIGQKNAQHDNKTQITIRKK